MGVYTAVNNNLLYEIDILGVYLFQTIIHAYDKMKGAIALCKSLPIFVDSPVMEWLSIEGAYRHCWNHCVAIRCSGWSSGLLSSPKWFFGLKNTHEKIAGGRRKWLNKYLLFHKEQE